MKEIIIVGEKNSIQENDIKNFEYSFNIILPEDYRNFLLKNNGGHPIHDFYNLIRHDIIFSSDLAWFYSLYYNEYENLEKKMLMFKKRIPDELLPIARDSGSNQICLCISGTNYGKVYYWDHNWEAEEGQEPTYDNIYLISNSFKDFINSLYEYKPA